MLKGFPSIILQSWMHKILHIVFKLRFYKLLKLKLFQSSQQTHKNSMWRPKVWLQSIYLSEMIRRLLLYYVFLEPIPHLFLAHTSFQFFVWVCIKNKAINCYLQSQHQLPGEFVVIEGNGFSYWLHVMCISCVCIRDCP